MPGKKFRQKEGFTNSKTDFESILIILHLLDSNGCIPDELVEKLSAGYIYDKNKSSNRIFIELYLNQHYHGRSSAYRQSVGRAIKNLEGIIEIAGKQPSTKPGGDPEIWNLINDISALKNILSRLYNGDINKDISRMVGSEILNSEYAKKLVDIDLVKETLNPPEQFKNKNSEQYDEELNNILNIIRTSPRALLRFISAKDHSKYELMVNKSNFITGLMTDFGNDLVGENISMGSALLVNSPIEYDIKIKFNPDITIQTGAVLKDNPFMEGSNQIDVQRPHSEIKVGKNEIGCKIQYPANPKTE